MKSMILSFWVLFIVAVPLCHTAIAKNEEDLAKKLANPISSLVSVPFQLNYDENIGPNEDGKVYKLNIQPVIPVSLNEDWNLISRTILPVVWQKDIAPGVSDESGLSDTVQSLFFSPKSPTRSGLIWGVGPVFLIPTATDEVLGSRKWGAGPTAVALMQEGPWTIGFLGNHIWSFTGDDDRANVSKTFVQPFLAYVTKTKTTIGINTESTYDWEADQWSVPVIASVSQMLKIGPQIFQIQLGARYWAESPDNGPDGWGARFALTFLFPK